MGWSKRLLPSARNLAALIDEVAQHVHVVLVGLRRGLDLGGGSQSLPLPLQASLDGPVQDPRQLLCQLVCQPRVFTALEIFHERDHPDTAPDPQVGAVYPGLVVGGHQQLERREVGEVFLVQESRRDLVPAGHPLDE